MKKLTDSVIAAAVRSCRREEYMYRAIQGGCGAAHPRAFRMSRPEGLSNYVLLLIRSCGEFEIDGTGYMVLPGHAVVFAPGTPYSYGNSQGEYLDDWLHFEAEEDSRLRELKRIFNRPFPVPDPGSCTALIRQILWETSFAPERYAQENVDALFTVLFNHLLSSCEEETAEKAPNPYREKLQALRMELKNSITQRHDIRECAGRIGVSPSYFQHLYTDCFGVPFQQDLIRMRVDYTKYILTATDLTLEQVAELCGYAGTVHFYRQFRQVTGTTPAKFRKRPV